MKKFFRGEVRWMDERDYQPWQYGLLEELTDSQILRCTTATFWISDLDFKREVFEEEQVRVGIQKGELLETDYNIFICDWLGKTDNSPDAFELIQNANYEASCDLSQDAF
jgi:hypothetical protein